MKLELTVNKVTCEAVSLEGVKATVEGTVAEITEALRSLVTPTQPQVAAQKQEAPVKETKEVKEPVRKECDKEKNIKILQACRKERPRTNHITVTIDSNNQSPIKKVVLDVNGDTYHIYTKHPNVLTRVLNAEHGKIDIVNFLDNMVIKPVINGKEVGEFNQLEKILFMDEICSMRAVKTIIRQ